MTKQERNGRQFENWITIEGGRRYWYEVLPGLCQEVSVKVIG